MLEADADPAGPAEEEEEEEVEMESRDLKAAVVRLTLELQEATEEKLQAARYGLVVLEESAALKTRHRQLEEEHESLREELQRLREVWTPMLLGRFGRCGAKSTRSDRFLQVPPSLIFS